MFRIVAIFTPRTYWTTAINRGITQNWIMISLDYLKSKQQTIQVTRSLWLSMKSWCVDFFWKTYFYCLIYYFLGCNSLYQWSLVISLQRCLEISCKTPSSKGSWDLCCRNRTIHQQGAVKWYHREYICWQWPSICDTWHWLWFQNRCGTPPKDQHTITISYLWP